jgi:hypothetical protein
MGPLSSQALGQLPSVPMTEDGTAQTPDYCNISCEHSTINKDKKIDTQQVGRQNNMNKETNNSRQNTTPLQLRSFYRNRKALSYLWMWFVNLTF